MWLRQAMSALRVDYITRICMLLRQAMSALLVDCITRICMWLRQATSALRVDLMLRALALFPFYIMVMNLNNHRVV